MEKYWREHSEMPQEVKDEIARFTRGRKSCAINVGGREIDLLETDGETFGKVFALNREYLFRGDHTAPAGENDYTDCRNYLTENGLAGFAVTADGWLVSLFSNLVERGFAESVKEIVKVRARKLVCVSGDEYEKCGLAKTYAKVFGFKYFAATINDERIMRKHYGDEYMDGFIARNGTPHHIFMVRTDLPVKEVKLFDEYFAAYDYVDLF